MHRGEREAVWVRAAVTTASGGRGEGEERWRSLPILQDALALTLAYMRDVTEIDRRRNLLRTPHLQTGGKKSLTDSYVAEGGCTD